MPTRELLKSLAIVLPHVCAAHSSTLDNSEWTSTEPKNLRKTEIVSIAALTCASLSMIASFIVFYWFCRMEKRFRHRLIMLLIYGDLMRASWYFVAATVMLIKDQVQTSSKFCQSTGFLIQYGTETNDFAVLVIAVHSALQVFHPSSQASSDGLYPYRRYVYAAGFLIPGMMAGLAFINKNGGYLSQGAFCSLPIRPLWYTLALAWIPRYLISVIIISLAIAIYTYVGFEFKRYDVENSSFQYSMDPVGLETSKLTRRATSIGPKSERGASNEVVGGDTQATEMTEQKDWAPYSRRASSIAHDMISPSGRPCSVFFTGIAPLPESFPRRPSAPPPLTRRSVQSLPGINIHLPLQRSSTSRPPLVAIPSGLALPITIPTEEAPSPSVSATPSAATTNAITIEYDSSATPKDNATQVSETSSATRQMVRQRARMHRQLRLLFIYPLIYAFMWLVPFVQQCLMYNDKYARHPLWFFRLGSTIFTASMGFVNCLVFALRERPWLSIQTSDGTLWGSFAVWRGQGGRRVGSLAGGSTFSLGLSRSGDAGAGGMDASAGTESLHYTSAAQSARSTSGGGGLGRAKSMVRTSSSSNEHDRLATEQARLRLDLEREERYRLLRERVALRQMSLTENVVLGNASSESSVAGEDEVVDLRAVLGGGQRVGKGKGRAVDFRGGG